MSSKLAIAVVAILALAACSVTTPPGRPGAVTADRNTHPLWGDAPSAIPKGYSVGGGVTGPEY